MNHDTTKSQKPAISHLFWWFLFAMVDRHYDTWINVLGNPIVKLYLLALISLAFFHFAHRLRYFLVDLGVPAARTLPAQVVFYGGAVVVTAVTIWVLLTTAPISFA